MIIGKLQEIDIELEDTLDALPRQSELKTNPRFQQSARERDLDDERQHVAKIAIMLRRHAELASRLAELDDEDLTDYVAQPQEDTSNQQLTGTQTAKELIGMFSQAAADLGQDAGGDQDLEEEGDAVASIQGEDDLFPGSESDSYVPWTTTVVSEPASSSTLATTTSPSITVSWVTATSGAPTTFTTASQSRPGPSQFAPTQQEVRFTFQTPLPPLPPRTFGPRLTGFASRARGAGPATSQVGGRPPTIRNQDTTRRRSQSNDFCDGSRGAAAARAREETREARLFELVNWIQTRKDVIATRLIGVEDAQTDQVQPGVMDPAWVDSELDFVSVQLERTEVAECETWQLLGKMQGADSRKRRAEGWRIWLQEVTNKMTTVRRRMARCEPVPSLPAGVSSSEPHSCQRRGGFLEQVKLPTFSGSVEDFGEFRTQFQELCRGENFTGVIELAQLRQKLPRDAVAMLRGLSTPDEAWARLEETYGNVDLQALEALKRLRTFKVCKSAAHEQVVEVAMAVQRCVTVLRALDREMDFIMDRETVAEVVGCLPADSQQRWYHRPGCRGESQLQKGRNLLVWLEEERADAVAIRLDALARKAKPAAAQTATPKSTLPAGGTDQPLYAGSHATMQGKEEQSDGQVHAGSSGGSGGDAASGARGGRVDVTTAQQAKEVAEKRRTNLETKKLDKCPMCKLQHSYEKTWSLTTPPTITKMVSTLLTSCPKFLAQPPDQKMVSITSHAACPHCTSWEHARHRYGGRELPDPKCKAPVQGGECGGKHGRWYPRYQRHYGQHGGYPGLPGRSIAHARSIRGVQRRVS